MMKISAVILAAGKGTRMGNDSPDNKGSEIPKVMYQANGKPLISYAVENIKNAGVKDIVLVVGYKQEMVRDYFKESVKYAVQKEQLGTGHAAMQARSILEGKCDAVIITYGDMPLYKIETIKKLIEIFENPPAEEKKPVLAMVTVEFSNPEFWAYGRVIRDEKGEVVANVEQKDCDSEQLKISECNPSFYLFDNNWLWNNFDKLSTDNAQGEYYLTDMIGLANEQGRKIATIKISSEEEVLGVNTREQLDKVEGILKRK